MQAHCQALAWRHKSKPNFHTQDKLSPESRCLPHGGVLIQSPNVEHQLALLRCSGEVKSHSFLASSHSLGSKEAREEWRAAEMCTCPLMREQAGNDTTAISHKHCKRLWSGKLQKLWPFLYKTEWGLWVWSIGRAPACQVLGSIPNTMKQDKHSRVNKCKWKR